MDVRCLDCAEPMSIRFLDDEILETEPATLVAHVNVPLPKWRELSSWFN